MCEQNKYTHTQREGGGGRDNLLGNAGRRLRHGRRGRMAAQLRVVGNRSDDRVAHDDQDSDGGVHGAHALRHLVAMGGRTHIYSGVAIGCVIIRTSRVI